MSLVVTRGADSHVGIDTISKACGHGALERLQQLLEENPGGVNQPDESGYLPIQWAALNNRLPEVNCLLAHGALVNAIDRQGATALHWAATRGCLPIIETLLHSNANYELRDNSGFTAVHAAAQNGQTTAIYLMALKWGVDIDGIDNEGRTPLHWAAYKGLADMTRLLIALDARCNLADTGGCTPLHWAAIRGHTDVCSVLLQGGSESSLMLKDSSGMVPSQLALSKGYRQLGCFLADYKREQDGMFGKKGRLGWVVALQMCPLMWVYILGMITFFVQKVMVTPSGLGDAATAFSWSAVVTVAAGLFYLYKTTTADPGYLAVGWDEQSRSQAVDCAASSKVSTRRQYQALDSPALWAGQWHQLCVSCRIVRPLRAKHCSFTDRCIEVFDHYCPWTGNAIGKGNVHYFLTFLWLEFYAILVSSVIGIMQIYRLVQGQQASLEFDVLNLIWLIGFAMVNMAVGGGVAGLAIAQTSLAAQNMTTNESINWHRYKYLQSTQGKFHNPFNKGCWANCTEVFSPSSTPVAPVYLTKVNIDSDSTNKCNTACCNHNH